MTPEASRRACRAAISRGARESVVERGEVSCERRGFRHARITRRARRQRETSAPAYSNQSRTPKANMHQPRYSGCRTRAYRPGRDQARIGPRLGKDAEVAQADCGSTVQPSARSPQRSAPMPRRSSARRFHGHITAASASTCRMTSTIDVTAQRYAIASPHARGDLQSTVDKGRKGTRMDASHRRDARRRHRQGNGARRAAGAGGGGADASASSSRSRSSTGAATTTPSTGG